MLNLIVYLLEDCEEDQYLFKKKLEVITDVNFKIQQFDNFIEFEQSVKLLTPDIVVTDLNLPESIGLETFLNVKKACPNCPIVILSGSNEEVALKAIQLGAQDYLEKQELKSSLIKRTLLFAKERFLMQKTVEEMAIRDKLTRLYNREAFEHKMAQQLEDYHRYKATFALIFVDLNNFKPINDEYGHLIGDKILQAIASRIITFNRISDFTARLGGDEFVIIANNISTPEELTQFIEAKKLRFNGDYIVSDMNNQVLELDINMSFGGAIVGLHGETLETLLQYADKAMYEDKKTMKANANLTTSLIDK